MDMEFSTILVTLKLSLVSTILLMFISIPLAWWLAKTHSKFRTTISTIVTLPLVLPPTVLGFYLLVGFGPSGPLGKITHTLGLGTLAFTFSGLVLGSIIYSLPFVVNPIKNSFELIEEELLEAASVLGLPPVRRFFRVILPLAKPGLITAFVLGFAHTLGEFGVVLMIGGNIPEKTRVLSVAIYDHVEALEYGQAHLMSGGLLIFSFFILWFVQRKPQASRVLP